MNCYPYYTDFLEIVKKAADHSDLQPTPDLFFLYSCVKRTFAIHPCSSADRA